MFTWSNFAILLLSLDIEVAENPEREKSGMRIGATLRYVGVRLLGPQKIPNSVYVLCPHPRTGCPDTRMGCGNWDRVERVSVECARAECDEVECDRAEGRSRRIVLRKGMEY
jgi:hypothetical protein